MKQKRRGQSIQNRIFWPIMLVIAVQLIVLSIVFLFGGLMNNMNRQSEYNLIDKTNNQANGIKSKMVKGWSEIDSFNKSIAETMEHILDAQSQTSEDLLGSTELSEQMILATSSYIISMIRATGATGAYIILDSSYGMKVMNEQVHPGFYIRDQQPGTDAADYSDLMVQVGNSSVTQMLRMPLTSYWTSRFDFANGEYSDTSFYDNPLAEARKIPGREPEDYGFWSDLYTFDEAEEPVLSYSQPIILSDGTVVGVLGVDISQTEIANVIQSNSSERDNTTCCILGKIEDEKPNTVMVMGKYGNLFVYDFGDDTRIELLDKKEHFYEIENRVNDKTTACMEELPVYNPDSPFNNHRWVVLTCKNNKEMYSIVNTSRRYILIITAMTFLCMIIAIRLASKSVSQPISKMSDIIHNVDANEELKVARTGIVEVDELMAAFSELREITMQHMDKLSEIISITNLPVGIFEYDRESKVFFCSNSFYEIVNMDLNKGNVGTNLSLTMEPQKYLHMWDYLQAMVYDEERKIYELTNEDGSLKWIQLHLREAENKSIGAVVDVSGEIIEQKKMAYERDFDLLTGLWNRRAFMHRLEELISESDKLNIACMIMVDTDNLKYVNDTYGHETGDNYLRLIANVLSGFTDVGGVVGRRSGDEFTIFLYGFQNQGEIRDIMTNVWKELNETVLPLPDGSSIGLRCSAGLAWYGTDSDEMTQLIRFSDFAMYEVKHTQKGSWVEFNEEHYQKESLLLYGHKSFDMLINDRMLDFAMQPIYHVREGKIYGYEMLMRSRLPEFKSPFDILRMAHSQSKLYQLEYACWYRALETFAIRVQQGELPSGCHAFVNSIGSIALTERDEKQLTQLFQPYMKDVVVELTEEEESSEEAVSRKVEVIKQFCGQIAIDDYGSGYNNVSSVLDITPDIIKVDLKIIRNIDKDAERQLLFQQTVSIARSKGALVVAEGVETKEELECVLGLGADMIQGYYLAMPSFIPPKIAPEAVDVMKEFVKKHQYD